MHKKLFIPGPVDVAEDVLQKMATPQISHRGKEASTLQRNISNKMRKVFNTKEEILLSTSSGSGLMEGAVRSCTAKRAAIFSVGAFGDRWFKMCTANGVPADKFDSEWGQPTTKKTIEDVLRTGKYDLITITMNETSTGLMNNIEDLSSVYKNYPEVVVCVDTVSNAAGTEVKVDEWAIDICITSTQKCLGLPAGMSICTFSKKAVARAKQVTNRGVYFDLLGLYDCIQKKDYQYTSTPSLSHMFALDYQLDKILKEGLNNRYARHIDNAKIVRTWAKKYFDIFPNEKFMSNTVTAIKNTRQIDVSDLNKKLGEKGFIISNGYGKLKDETFRIAHMAETTQQEIKALLETINGILGLK
ncbi:pyridoxal-phosphate-dependent aminotransferase family protein [Clostridium psychrophilum]|uniref:pyridoxal-phosphate-dependent aminotransferase family protein n=1 Tax=Clostridium psychrophilum TaxID=132926 RepID=UPI001C0DFBDB|nr:alanine--glyoxylate aminotransferase family protein [Clostridium psychrophilum]MBU3182615.1 alanine--glyoxylate aminotransferase family protein [Clostridium psychrophilum]